MTTTRPNDASPIGTLSDPLQRIAAQVERYERARYYCPIARPGNVEVAFSVGRSAPNHDELSRALGQVVREMWPEIRARMLM